VQNTITVQNYIKKKYTDEARLKNSIINCKKREHLDLHAKNWLPRNHHNFVKISSK
jgi:hypothetical protein